ncbi:coiled-coil domain-containing protein 137 [Huso huso]|uniref:Coiled-coil domain-containing protein 137 n=1 Tax=Huso huso TaxID=61971 RepID=A0ABR0Z4W7_HUSHU
MRFTTVPGKINCRGAVKGLHLTSLMGTPLAAGAGSVKPSMVRHKMMLEERERVVKAYRDLKKIKHERLHSNTASLKWLQNLK